MTVPQKWKIKIFRIKYNPDQEQLKNMIWHLIYYIKITKSQLYPKNICLPIINDGSKNIKYIFYFYFLFIFLMNYQILFHNFYCVLIATKIFDLLLGNCRFV